MTAQELAGSVAAMVAHAHATGGGRTRCCARGLCAAHLAEQDSRYTVSRIHFGHTIAEVPNYDDQALAVAVTVAAIDMARARLGVQ